MRCLVVAGKHGNNIRTIARQLLGKRVPAARDTQAKVEVLLGYKNGNGDFYVVRAEILYGGLLEFRSWSCQQQCS
jgi:hypothetical protein